MFTVEPFSLKSTAEPFSLESEKTLKTLRPSLREIRIGTEAS